MSKQSFIDKIDDETLARMIDATLKFEKNKARGVKADILKLISAVAVFLLVVGIASMSNIFNITNGGGLTEAPGAAVTSGNPDEPENIIGQIAQEQDIIETEPEDTVTTQIGDLIITAPRGQEPVDNGDGTITLPGGGTYIGALGDKFTVPGGALINKYGGVETSLFTLTGDIIIEKSNGDIIILDENGNMTINGNTVTEFYREMSEEYIAMILEREEIRNGNADAVMDRINTEIMENIRGAIGNGNADAVMDRINTEIMENIREAIINANQVVINASGYEELTAEIYAEAVLVEREYQDISDISLNLRTDNIIVSRGGDSVKVKYYEWTDGEYELSVDGGRLELKYAASDKFFRRADGSISDDWIHGALAEAGRPICPENAGADRRTVEITVPEHITLESLNIKNINGGIYIHGISVKTIKAEVILGNITLTGCTNGQDYRAVSLNGYIYIVSCNGVQNFTVQATNSSVDILSCRDIQTFAARAVNGSVIVKDSSIETLVAHGKTHNNVEDGIFNSNRTAGIKINW